MNETFFEMYHLNPTWRYYNERRERALPGLASDLAHRQKADNGLPIAS